MQVGGGQAVRSDDGSRTAASATYVKGTSANRHLEISIGQASSIHGLQHA